ncbi:MAG: nitroreductase family protein [Peptococcaceae bacterium]
MKRELEQEVMEQIVQRYSTMYFGPGEVAEEDLQGILLAATQAPSAYNEQPWRFFVARTPQDKEMLMEYMLPGEREWIAAAPVLILVAGNMGDTHNGLFNYWTAFDSGCAWGYLSLEAQRRGYVTHCIGSFDRVDLRNEFQMSENLELYGIVALGRPAATEVTQKEKQMPRKSVNSVLLRRR